MCRYLFAFAGSRTDGHDYGRMRISEATKHPNGNRAVKTVGDEAMGATKGSDGRALGEVWKLCRHAAPSTVFWGANGLASSGRLGRKGAIFCACSPYSFLGFWFLIRMNVFWGAWALRNSTPSSHFCLSSSFLSSLAQETGRHVRSGYMTATPAKTLGSTKKRVLTNAFVRALDVLR